MSKEKAIAAPTLLQELTHVGVYKRSQGRITRQVTGAVLLFTALIAAWRLNLWLEGTSWWSGFQYAVPLVVAGLGSWAAFRAVNWPKFADFLIAVEAEMNKVSWPSKGELIRSSCVVIFVIFALAAILFGYDLFWKMFFEFIGVTR
jgi:preprotein translocase subunit SecE